MSQGLWTGPQNKGWYGADTRNLAGTVWLVAGKVGGRTALFLTAGLEVFSVRLLLMQCSSQMLKSCFNQRLTISYASAGF